MPNTQSQDHYNKGATNLQQYIFKVEHDGTLVFT